MLGESEAFGEDDCLMEHLQAVAACSRVIAGQTCKLRILMLIPVGSIAI